MARPTVADEVHAYLAGRGANPWERARNEAPVFHSEVLGAAVVSRWEDVAKVLQDEETYHHVTTGPGSPVFRGSLLEMTGEEHRRKVGVLGRRLKSRGSLEAVVARVAQAHLGRRIEHLRRGPSRVDLAAELNEPFPLQVIAELVAIPEAERFRGWYRAIAAAGAGNPTGDPKVRRAGECARDDLYDFVEPIIESRREAPGDDLLSDLVSTAYEGERLSVDEVKSFLALILTGGVETTARSLTSLQRHLFDDPSLWETLRADRELIVPACAEALRLYAPVPGLMRRVVQDTELAGRTLRAGSKVYVSIVSANRDERKFPDPAAFQVDRFRETADRQFSPRADLLSFGGGRHFCTGALLAKLEMQMATDALLDNLRGAEVIEATTKGDGVLGQDNRLLVDLRFN